MIAFKAQGCERHFPAFANRSKAHRVRYPNVIEENFVERRTTAHLLDRANFNTWKIHRDDECGHTFVLDNINIAACDEFTPLGELCS